MTIEDLKVGMILEIKMQEEEEEEITYCMILPAANGVICVSGPDFWCPLFHFKNDFSYENVFIQKVYGLCLSNKYAHALSSQDRKLLWTRPEVKELTLKQIEELLGYSVKIVEESE